MLRWGSCFEGDGWSCVEMGVVFSGGGMVMH